MIVDTMTKLEVMKIIRNDFDNEVFPYYAHKLKPKLQALVRTKAQREKKIVSLGWEDYTTSSGIVYKIHKRGNAYEDKPEFVAEFFWNKKKCIAILLQSGTIIIYQSHSLERYADRVIKANLSNTEILKRYLLKHIDSSFQIVLPTPTHPYSSFLVMANALFLGDFDTELAGEKDLSAHWYNTCLSLNECHYTQEQIMQTLAELQKDVLSIGFNPVNFTERSRYFSEKNELLKTRKESLTNLFSNTYMLFLLQKSFDFPFYDKIKEEIYECQCFLENELTALSIDINTLDPYDAQNGIAKKGELDYKR